jgi:MYXO-CTERM domain-containing protein
MRHLLFTLALALPCHASVVVTGGATFDAMTTLYTYSYSVQNLGMEDIVLLTIPVDRGAAITNIMNPLGFELTFDPSQGSVNLTEDNNILTVESFAPNTTVGTFRFTSPLAPLMVSFSAFDATGTEFLGTVAAPVPEAGAASLGALGLAAAGLRRRRRQF